MLIENVLPEGWYNGLLNTARAAPYTPLGRGDETSIFVSKCSSLFTNKLVETLRDNLGDVEVITSYLRYNGTDVDNHLRVHSDRDIEGQQPDWGVVYYLDNQEGGTGMYTHKVYGDSLPDGVLQPEEEYGDESLWTLREVLEGKNNTMNVYPARNFHMRHPVKPTNHRLVWVAFLKEKNNG